VKTAIRLTPLNLQLQDHALSKANQAVVVPGRQHLHVEFEKVTGGKI
jgi:hypothetical protein